MNNIKHDIKCDKCDKPAVYNLQNNWQLYDVIENGDYVLNKEWEGESNEHFCEEHYREEMTLCVICGQGEDDDGRCGCTNKDAE